MQRCINFEEQAPLDPQTGSFYRRVLDTLNAAQIPFLVGGAYAFACYTGISRHTKDFDIFVRRVDYQRTLDLLAGAGYRTELTFPHWLGKAYDPESDAFIDVIFSSGNGVAEVDDSWFDRAADGEVLGLNVKLIPAEEMIWSKAFIQERERYDGADVAHVLQAYAEKIDWQHMIERFDSFDSCWRILFSHLVLFGFIYPSERGRIPDWVLEEMVKRLRAEMAAPPLSERVCMGTLISREQYLMDIRHWGYSDGRLQQGTMDTQEIAHWTAAIDGGDQEQAVGGSA